MSRLQIARDMSAHADALRARMALMECRTNDDWDRLTALRAEWLKLKGAADAAWIVARYQ